MVPMQLFTMSLTEMVDKHVYMHFKHRSKHCCQRFHYPDIKNGVQILFRGLRALKYVLHKKFCKS